MSAEGAAVAWLTTLRPDGSPHTTPVWFVLEDQAFWFASAAVNVKVRNIARDPRVCVAIDGSGVEPDVAEGRARLHRDPASRADRVAALAEKYPGWDPTDESHDGPRVLIEVPVERWLLGGGR